MNVASVDPVSPEGPVPTGFPGKPPAAKPVVLVFSRYYLPGFRAGGPIRTIANIVERLGDKFEFRVIASDRDLGAQIPYPDADHARWLSRGKAMIRYVAAERFGLREVAEIVRSTPHDVIYLNSFYDPRFTQQVLVNERLGRLAGRPIVLAPRGEFSEGAQRLKRLKKSIFLRAAKMVGLYEDLVWQVSSLHEAQDVQRALHVGQPKGLRGSLVVTGHMASALDDAGSTKNIARSGDGSRLRICFLSRVSPMKNLDYALSALVLVRTPVCFTIYGPIEDESYWSKCRELISLLPSHIEVKYEGEVEHACVVETLATHDLFFLPTRGENFGHVIHEAMKAGLPLLISDQTPWRQLVEAGVGWDLPLDNASSFAQRIEDVAKWTDVQRTEAATRCRQLAQRRGDDVATVVAHERLFLDAILTRTPR